MAKEITATMIKELRDRTGVGMGKCKEALEAAGGDLELAIANLRKAGIASAVKKEGRTTNEGMIGTAEKDNRIGIIELNAETDFVVRNDRFQQFLRNLAEEVAATNPSSLDAFKKQPHSKDKAHTIEEMRAILVQTIGENIQIRRLKVIPKSSDKSIGLYSHMRGKLLTLVEISGSNAEQGLAKEIAMHVAAASPEYLSEKDVPATTIENEREIAKSQIKGKPENIIGKIVDGKIMSYYDAHCLLRQKYIKDDQLTISELVAKRGKEVGKPLAVTSFLRWGVGQ